MEVNQLPELDIRLVSFPPSPVYVTFLANGQDYSYGVIAVVEGVIEFAEYISLLQSKATEIYFIKRATLVRAITCEPVKLYIVQFSEQFAHDNLYNLHTDTLSTLFSGDISRVTADRYNFKIIRKLLSLLHKHNSSEASPNSLVIRQLTFNLLLSCISELKGMQVPIIQSTAKYKTVLAIRFFRLVEEHALAQHSVKFYAAALCMTQGNLTRIIKEVTAKLPKSIIEEFLIQKAKMMLDSNLLTVYSIAEELGFKSSSAFISFFRFHSGHTPNEYRNRKSTHL
jgi:AraC family transcriptional regulator, transcriptional activator of pobA